VNGAILRPYLPIFFFFTASLCYGVTPVLRLAPPPPLSEAAWRELQSDGAQTTNVTLHVQIIANKGAISSVTIKEASRLPISSAEVQGWISQRWKFVGAFSGTVNKPISFRVVRNEVVQMQKPTEMVHSATSDSFQCHPEK
jgi:hypothetical protein